MKNLLESSTIFEHGSRTSRHGYSRHRSGGTFWGPTSRVAKESAAGRNAAQHAAAGKFVEWSMAPFISSAPLTPLGQRPRAGWLPKPKPTDAVPVEVYFDEASLPKNPSSAGGVDSSTRSRRGESENNMARATPTTPPSESRAAAAASAENHHQQQQHPLGSMFCPELDKDGVLAVVLEVLCRPGFTSGPRDEKRLLRNVRNGRIDVRDMARLLRWLTRESIARELRERGLKFVGPRGEGGLQPYTTGLGMSFLMEEVVAGNHPAGTRFVVCFSSNFEACAGVVAGVLVDDVSNFVSNPASDDAGTESGFESVSHFGLEPGSAAATKDHCRSTSEDGTSSTWSLSNKCDRVTPAFLGEAVGRHAAAATTTTARGIVGGSVGGSVGATTSRGRRGSNADSFLCGSRNARETIALLLDEKPKHRCRSSGGGGGGGGGSGSNSGVSAGVGSGGDGVSRMGVREWVEAYGECDGPMLAAWVFFPGRTQDKEE